MQTQVDIFLGIGSKKVEIKGSHVFESSGEGCGIHVCEMSVKDSFSSVVSLLELQ